MSSDHENKSKHAGLVFEWDPAKARNNVRAHRVGFEEALTVFGDPLSITVPDPQHSRGEFRFVIVGRSRQGRLLIVAHTERGDRIRIISARPASRRERTQYEEA